MRKKRIYRFKIDSFRRFNLIWFFFTMEIDRALNLYRRLFVLQLKRHNSVGSLNSIFQMGILQNVMEMTMYRSLHLIDLEIQCLDLYQQHYLNQNQPNVYVYMNGLSVVRTASLYNHGLVCVEFFLAVAVAENVMGYWNMMKSLEDNYEMCADLQNSENEFCAYAHPCCDMVFDWLTLHWNHLVVEN